MKTLFTFTLALLISFSVYAKKVPGNYIDLQGNKVETVFKVKHNFFQDMLWYSSIDCSIKYFGNNEIKRLTPNMCKSISLYNNGKKELFYSLMRNYKADTNYRNNSIFARQKISGPVSLFYYYYTTHTTNMGYNGTMSTTSRQAQGWMMVKENGQQLKITYGGGKRKDLAAFFADNEELADKILNKDKSINAKDTKALVEMYNKWKLNKEAEVKNTVPEE